MKMLMFWVVLIIVSLVVYVIFDKVSIISTVFDESISSPWFDLSLVILLGYIAVLRTISFVSKVFG